jgi:hypothetical protein
MKFLVITQDLRISGTSAGVGRRSFIAKLKKNYPNSIVDVFYISHFDASNDKLEGLPADNITRRKVNHKIPAYVKWINRLTTRVFNYLYAEDYIHKKYAKHLQKIDHSNYDHIFIWSSGISHETILASLNLPILKKAVVVFHDPYPNTWYNGMSTKIHKNEFLRLQKMIKVVQQAKVCCATAYYMAKDLQYLYASDKHFHTLPHFFEKDAFDFSKKDKIRKKGAKLQIAYHGALMLGRNIFNVLEAYTQLMEENQGLQNNTEFILRVKGDRINELKEKYGSCTNIEILDTLDFSNSANEQLFESDINVILENGPHYCNILPGKVPFLAAIGKPVLVVSPERSELRRIMKNNEHYIAAMNSVEDIKSKLEKQIQFRMESNEKVNPFGDYFSDASFKMRMNTLLQINDLDGN